MSEQEPKPVKSHYLLPPDLDPAAAIDFATALTDAIYDHFKTLEPYTARTVVENTISSLCIWGRDRDLAGYLRFLNISVNFYIPAKQPEASPSPVGEGGVVVDIAPVVGELPPPAAGPEIIIEE